MEILTCLVHIDASLLNFKFKEALYVDVKYGTNEQTKMAFIADIAIPPSVLREINNIPEFIRTCEEAANHNAKQYWQHKETGDRPASNLPSAIQQSLRPFVNSL